MINPKVKLRDVCEFVRGLTYSKKDEVEFSSNAVLRATNIDLASNRLNLADIRYISDDVKIKDDKKVKVNDILICTASGSKSHLGKVALIEEELDMAFGGFMGVLRVKPNVDAGYLFNYLTSDIFLKYISNLGDGANINNLKFSQIEDLELALPSIPTQKSIVNKINAISNQIEVALTSAEINTNNAEALFQSYLTEIFQRGNDGWMEARLKDITSKIGSGATPKGGSESYKETGISLIRSMNVYDNGFLYDNLAFIDEKQAKELNNVTVEKDDVLINITGASVARCCIVPEGILPARVNQHVSILRVNKNVIHPQLLHFLLISPLHKNKLLNVGEGGGTTRQAITKTQLQEYVIRFPKDLDSQLKLIDKIKNIQMVTLEMKKAYELKRDNFMPFKQSILQQAFSGELIKE